MRLVGASDAFIRWPFVFEGALVGPARRGDLDGRAHRRRRAAVAVHGRLLPDPADQRGLDLARRDAARRRRGHGPRRRRRLGVRPDLPDPLGGALASRRHRRVARVGLPPSHRCAERRPSRRPERNLRAMLPHDDDTPADPGRASTGPAERRPRRRPASSTSRSRRPSVPAPPVERRRGWPFAVVHGPRHGHGRRRAVHVRLLGRARRRVAAPGARPPIVDAWKPFWTSTTPSRRATRSSPSTATTLIEGAIRGLVESVGDPYSSYLSPEDFTGHAQRHLGHVRGHRRRDRLGRRRPATPATARRSGPSCHLVIIAPHRGLAGREGRAQAGRRHPRRSTARRSTASRPTRPATASGARPAPRSRSTSSASRRPRRRPARPPAPAARRRRRRPRPPRELLEEFDVTLVRAKIQRREVTVARAGRRHGRLRRASSGFSERGREAARGRDPGPPRQRHQEDRPRPARQPGRLRHGRRATSPASSSRTARSTGSEDAEGSQTEVDASAGRHRDRSVDPGRRPHRPRVRLGERDRRRRAPGPRPGDS